MIDLNAANNVANKLKTANTEIDSAITKLKKAKENISLNGSNDMINPVISALDREITKLENLKSTVENTGTSISKTAKSIYDEQVAEQSSYSGSNSGSGSYTVQKGDNLYRIAKRNGTTVQALKELNGLTSDIIIVGQKIRVK